MSDVPNQNQNTQNFTNAPKSALNSGGVKLGSKPKHVMNPATDHSIVNRQLPNLKAKQGMKGTRSRGNVK